MRAEPLVGTKSRSSVSMSSGGFGRFNDDAVAEGFYLSGETPQCASGRRFWNQSAPRSA